MDGCSFICDKPFFLSHRVGLGGTWLDFPADSFGGPAEEKQSSAPGGPGDDLLGGGSPLELKSF